MKKMKISCLNHGCKPKNVSCLRNGYQRKN